MRYLIPLLLLVLSLSSVRAQTIDPYRRLTDPRAIMDLQGEDVEPLRYSCGVAWPTGRDPLDGAFVIAEGEGPGIITHIWMQLYEKHDTAVTLKIYIDDTLVIEDYLYAFFKRANGVLRPPLDSVQSGGLVCDVQIPFKRNFRITFLTGFENCCLFRAVGWRPVRDPSLVESFRPQPSQRLKDQQQAAEAIYWDGRSPWRDTPAESYQIKRVLGSNEAIEQLLPGPGLITELHVKPSNYDAQALRDVWMEFYWDGSPTASVMVPLADFFGAGAGMRDVRSHPIRTKSDGIMTSYFPMPFVVSAKLRFVNRAAAPIELDVTIMKSSEPIDRQRLGYFVTEFNERKKLAYSIHHPTAYQLGRGKFVGMQLFLPVWEPGYFLEGDPIFHVDSNWENYTQYTGSEDYFNGGWFFSDGPMSLPFAGCTHIHTSLYRFHYLDAVDFKSSFELKLQHGVQNDFKAWYRTVAYFYKQWTPFWTSLDTVARGKSIQIGGTGYQTNQAISIQIGDVISNATADANGAFSSNFTIPTTIRPGGYFVTVNGEQKPKPLWITTGPDVYFIRDTFPTQVRWKDPVSIFGHGFAPNSRVRLYLDSVPFSAQTFMTNAAGSLAAQVQVPYAEDGEYKIVVRSDDHEWLATSSESLSNTRTLNFEIENLWPPVLNEGVGMPDYMGYFWTPFSEQYYLFFYAEPQKRIVVNFNVPVADTFDVSIYMTKGLRFGDYSIQLNSTPGVNYYGFENRDYYQPIRSGAISLGRHYLPEGEHYLTFTVIGKHDSATEYLMGADNIVLQPVTAFRNPVAEVRPMPLNREINVYPNPATGLMSINTDPDSAGQLYSVII
ncbi:MAG TPA: DUF2961 domain-containing protein [Candidatus Kapabacteria bacterium]|nr:DUF2961 domain-containing protein [Candidatus Kapabacteria bacterium]